MCGEVAYRPPAPPGETVGTPQKIPGDVLLSMAVAADMALIAICTVLAGTEYRMNKDASDWVDVVRKEPFGWGRMWAPAVVTAALLIGAAVFVQRSQRIKGVGWHPRCTRVHRLTARFCDWTGEPLTNEWMDGRCVPREQVLKQALFQGADGPPVSGILNKLRRDRGKNRESPPELTADLLAADLPLKKRLLLIERLEVLLDSGHLSVEEFEGQKMQLLSN